jgi:hypothetical protein
MIITGLSGWRNKHYYSDGGGRRAIKKRAGTPTRRTNPLWDCVSLTASLHNHDARRDELVHFGYNFSYLGNLLIG